MAGERRAHDVGGIRRGGSIARHEHDPTDWEVLTDAVRLALTARGLVHMDEVRRATEDLGPELYRGLSYFGRRVTALDRLLAEKGLLRGQDGGGRTPVPATSGPTEEPAGARFAVGERVRVHDRWPPGHVRTPGYVRGHSGRVVAVHGAFPDPEHLAYGHARPSLRWLYTVEFSPDALWPEDGQEGRSRSDVVLVDLYEHWIDREE